MAERMDDDRTTRSGVGPYAGSTRGGANMHDSGAGSGEADNPTAIRADIRETRERLGDTLEEIGDRLNPRHLTEQVKDNLRDATIGRVEHMARSAADRVNETRYSVMDTVRDNPIPAAMIGIGLGWLFMNRRRHESTDVTIYRGETYRTAGAGYYDAGAAESGYGYAGAPYGSADLDASRTDMGADMGAGTTGAGEERGAMGRARDKASHMGHDVKERASHLTHDVRDTAGNVAHGAQERARQASDRAQYMARNVADRTRHQARRVEDRYYEQPLAMGAATLAIGLAAGLAIPASDREVRIMGDTRDRVVDRVREAASGTAIDTMDSAVERVADKAKSAVEETARDHGLV